MDIMHIRQQFCGHNQNPVDIMHIQTAISNEVLQYRASSVCVCIPQMARYCFLSSDKIEIQKTCVFPNHDNQANVVVVVFIFNFLTKLQNKLFLTEALKMAIRNTTFLSFTTSLCHINKYVFKEVFIKKYLCQYNKNDVNKTFSRKELNILTLQK